MKRITAEMVNTIVLFDTGYPPTVAKCSGLIFIKHRFLAKQEGDSLFCQNRIAVCLRELSLSKTFKLKKKVIKAIIQLESGDLG